MAAPDPAAFVAAGGRSTRMGRDKALLPWGGSTLLDHALGLLREAFGEARVLCGPVPRYATFGAGVVPDRLPSGGPLAGLDAALAAAPGRRVLLLAVDLPFVTPELLRWLAAQDDADVAAPRGPDGRPEPLCAVYGPACAGPVAERLAAGERRMTSFWPDVRVREIPAEDLARFGPPERLFTNLNDPRAYDAARPR